MPAMASVETMPRTQEELLAAGRSKLEQFKQRRKGGAANKNKNKNVSLNPNASPGRISGTSESKIYENGNPRGDASRQDSVNSHSDVSESRDVGVEVVSRNGTGMERARRIQIEEEEVRREEREAAEEKRLQLAAAEEARRAEQEAEELRKKEREAEEVRKKAWEAEEQRAQQVELAKRIENEAEERKRKQQEAVEASRKELEADEARRQLQLADAATQNERETQEAKLKEQREAEEVKRKEHEAEEARRKEREAEETKKKEQEAEEERVQLLIAEAARRKEREAEEAKRKEEEVKRRQRFIAEFNRKKELESEEIKRKEREAEEVKRKDREAEEMKRRQREEEEARRKQREEFAGLEQHIQDLTEEKFALQRELAKARAMAEDLVSENSALVEDFNNQGQVVNQLKEEIERLEGRIREQEGFARNLMSERDRAHQEHAAALEQSQTMAGEVIALENRIRTLRSHELKMEKDMSNLNTEIESHRKQSSAWEKDRAHLKTLIDALQEEKKVLQVRIRKLASGERELLQIGENVEASHLRERILADASTSTEDLQVEPLKISSEGPSTPLASPSLDSWRQGRQFEEPLSSRSTALTSQQRSSYETSQSPLMRSPLSNDGYSHLLSSEADPSTSSAVTMASPKSGWYNTVHLPTLSTSVPADVMRMINHINDVITSIGEEKAALVKALKAESKGAAELRAANSDLSRKLEATTQQLELVVAQRMAEGSSNGEVVTSNAPAALDYVDEGDEVVERVFTWIMQLFPGRNSRRNGLKRL